MRYFDHILMVSPDAPPHTGGMGRHVGCLARGLRDAGMNVDIVSRHSRPFLFRCGRNIAFSVGLWRMIRPLVRDQSIVHLHAGPGGAFLVPPDGVRFVITANHTYAQQSRMPGQWWKRIFLPWERAVYRRADSVVCISEDTADVLQRAYGVPAEKITVADCGFDLTPWQSADTGVAGREPFSCVFVGRPDVRKGWDLLTEAWAIVRAELPEACLHVVGWREADERGMRFHGRMDDDALAVLVGRSRAVVCPSRMEGFGLAAAEGIAAGTPVVATDTDGLRRTVSDGVSGLLVSPDSSSIAQGILRVLTDDALWSDLHAGAVRERSRFAVTREVRTHMELYSALY